MSNETPNNCPNNGSYPLNVAEIVTRLEKIEDEMRESRKYRYEINEAYSKVLDEVRVNISHHDCEIDELRTMHKEVIDALKGVMGRSGLIKEAALLETRVQALEVWKRDIKAFMAGALAICSIVSAALTTLLGYLVHFIKN